MDEARVLVVGAGLAGLALARALGQAGFAPEVVERRPPGPTPGRACTCPPTGSRPWGRSA